MIEITQEMLDRLENGKCDREDLARELKVGYGTIDYAIDNKYAEGTPCHNCKHVNMGGMYPCNDCIRKHPTDHYEHIDIQRAYTIDDLAQALGKTKKQTLSYMLQQCKDVDYQCIPENGFDYKKEVDVWWAERKNDIDLLFGIFDEYYGVEDTIKMLSEEREDD